MVELKVEGKAGAGADAPGPEGAKEGDAGISITKESLSQGDVDKPQEANPIEEAKKLVSELKEQNKVFSENLAKAAKLQAEMIMQGRGMGGGAKTQEEKEIDEARQLIGGTGFDDDLFPRKKPAV